MGPGKVPFRPPSSSVKSGSLWFLPLGGLCGLGELTASVLPLLNSRMLDHLGQRKLLSPKPCHAPTSPRVKEAKGLPGAPESYSASSPLHSSKRSMALVPPTRQRLRAPAPDLRTLAHATPSVSTVFFKSLQAPPGFFSLCSHVSSYGKSPCPPQSRVYLLPSQK